MGGIVSRRKKGAYGAAQEEKPEPVKTWVEHVYRIQDPDGNDFNITIGREECPELMEPDDLYPSTNDVLFYISKEKNIPPGCLAVHRMIMDWTSPIKDLDEPIKPEWPERKSAQLKYEIVPVGKFPKKLTMKKLDVEGLARCEQYFYYDKHLEPDCPFDGNLMFSEAIQGGFDNVSLAIANTYWKHPKEIFHRVEGEKKVPIFLKVCRRSEKVGLAMLKRDMVSRLELNSTDVYDATAVHYAIQAGFARLAYEIIRHPRVERSTLENLDKVSGHVPLEAARYMFGDGLNKMKRFSPVYEKLRRAITHKVAKLKACQKKKKIAMLEGKVGQIRQSMPTCSCGNIFMNDSAFCRRCGAKRPEDAKGGLNVREQGLLNISPPGSPMSSPPGSPPASPKSLGQKTPMTPSMPGSPKSQNQPPTPEGNKAGEQPTGSTTAAGDAPMIAAYSSVTPMDSEI